jgi:hypothetical protein
MSATRTEAVTASEHLGMLNSSLEFVNQKLHNNLTRPHLGIHLQFCNDYDMINGCKAPVFHIERGRRLRGNRGC